MFMRKLLLVISLMTCTLSASAGLFNVTVNNQGGLTATQASSFELASLFWNYHLVGIQEDANLNLVIDASGPVIDGVGGILGQAGPRSVGSADGNFLYATYGVMEFDSADLANLETEGSLFDVILHEMAHVIGFGSLWNPEIYGIPGFQNVYEQNTGRYTGQYALDMFREEFDPTAEFVPVELDGGPGTANGHWDESWLGGTFDSDLMTGYLDFPTTLSNTTLASFADIGYIVRLNDGRILGLTEVPVPATLLLFVTGIVLLGRRRK
ncbi:PEP-CTERM sorting domain-containing protein [Thalassotalea sp. M1531]|uniref:PEP-CTERM sorting domain-containing protein n=1 Tax=Thalassotalea algicola TaxID=2716224 RepID=A0A7Y0L9F3_9GAMM|nr:PEP-CTERM sorting domain-containing protein [Thalassotalea algicola]